MTVVRKTARSFRAAHPLRRRMRLRVAPRCRRPDVVDWSYVELIMAIALFFSGVAVGATWVTT